MLFQEITLLNIRRFKMELNEYELKIVKSAIFYLARETSHPRYGQERDFIEYFNKCYEAQKIS